MDESPFLVIWIMICPSKIEQIDSICESWFANFSNTTCSQDDSNHDSHHRNCQKVIRDLNLIPDSSIHYLRLLMPKRSKLKYLYMTIMCHTITYVVLVLHYIAKFPQLTRTELWNRCQQFSVSGHMIVIYKYFSWLFQIFRHCPMLTSALNRRPRPHE